MCKHVGNPTEVRMARCTCGRERPSSEAAEGKLAFFEDRTDASETCKHCHYSEVAHGSGREYDLQVHPHLPPRRDLVAEGKCPGFEPHEPWDYDTYYCGCRGWD